MNITSIIDGKKRPVSLDFKAGLTNIAGIVAAAHHLRKNTFYKKLCALLPNTFKRTHSQKTRYPNEHLLWQRIMAHIAGYSDLNDHDQLKNDPAFTAAIGKHAIASSSTLCRFEQTATEETIRKGNTLLQELWHTSDQLRKVTIIDVDNTPCEVYGEQEGRKYNGHYQCNCYLPLVAYVEGYPVAIFNGNEDGRKTLIREFHQLIARIRQKRPETVILLRADSAFNSTLLIDMCEKLGVYYLMGLSPNRRLARELEGWDPKFFKVLRQGNPDGLVIRGLREIEDYMAQSWSGPRRVIARNDYNYTLKEWDPRFIQTNIPRKNNGNCYNLWEYTPEELYEKLYCQRGTFEKVNAELKNQAFGGRVSAHGFLTNSFRMLLGALCQTAYRMFGDHFKKYMPWKYVTLARFRDTFIRVAGCIKGTQKKLTITLGSSVRQIQYMERFWKLQT